MDETVVGTASGFATTTHVNLLGYKLTKNNLEEGAAQSSGRPFFYMGHDTDDPPVGKIVKSEVRELGDGEYGLWVEIQLYDEIAVEAIKLHGGISIGLRTGSLGGFG